MKKLLIAALVLLSAQLSAQSLSTLTKDYPTFDTIYGSNDTVLYLLDDGNRPEVKELCNHLGCKYITRPSNEHAKAGNPDPCTF